MLAKRLPAKLDARGTAGRSSQPGETRALPLNFPSSQILFGKNSRDSYIRKASARYTLATDKHTSANMALPSGWETGVDPTGRTYCECTTLPRENAILVDAHHDLKFCCVFCASFAVVFRHCGCPFNPSLPSRLLFLFHDRLYLQLARVASCFSGTAGRMLNTLFLALCLHQLAPSALNGSTSSSCNSHKVLPGVAGWRTTAQTNKLAANGGEILNFSLQQYITPNT